MELAGKTALVTGGAVRIGRAISLGLARAGAAVVVHYGGSATAATGLVAEIAALGREAITVQADLSNPEEASRALMQSAVNRFGSVDVLVNSAAIFEPSTIVDVTEEHWNRHFAINLQSPAFLCREFAKQLPTDARGQIVNIADWRGIRTQPGHLAYTLTKSGIISLTKLLAVELAPRIRVNAVAPGAILPPPGADQDHLERMAATIPLRRTGTPEDVVQAVLHLVRSEFVTGEILFVTGGEHLC